jgi:ribosomal-protein-alanine N-acetyltransferase
MAETTVLQTDRLLLRTWQDEDLDDLVALHSHLDVSRYLSRHGKPWTHAEAADRIAGWMREFKAHGITKLKLLRREDERFLGRAGLSFFAETDQFELGYSLAPNFWGQGYATEIASALACHFFRLNLRNRFIAFAHIDNAASLKVLKKIGMIYDRTGPMGDLQCHVYSMDRAEIEEKRRWS